MEYVNVKLYDINIAQNVHLKLSTVYKVILIYQFVFYKTFSNLLTVYDGFIIL